MSGDIIVSSDGFVCLVGAGPVQNGEIVHIIQHAAHLVAADGGADHLLAAGLTPDAVIGDLDSLSAAARATFAHVLHHIAEQESTDFEKALTRIDAPGILAVGFTGGRMDHTLAVLNAMARWRTHRVFLLGLDDVSFLAVEPLTRLSLPLETRISLMPLDKVTVDTAGLYWPVSDALMQPAGFISASNKTAAPLVEIFANGPLLITLPRLHLQAALQAAALAR